MFRDAALRDVISKDKIALSREQENCESISRVETINCVSENSKRMRRKSGHSQSLSDLGEGDQKIKSYECLYRIEDTK